MVISLFSLARYINNPLKWPREIARGARGAAKWVCKNARPFCKPAKGFVNPRNVISKLKRGLRHLQPLDEGLQLAWLLVFPRDVQVLLQSLFALRDGGGGDVAESSDLLVFAKAHAQEAAEFDLRLA